MLGSTLLSRSTKKAIRYSSSNGDPSFTFLLRMLRFLSRFFLIPVVVEIVYSLAALLDTDTSLYISSFSKFLTFKVGPCTDLCL